MAKHTVNFEVPERELGKADLIFVVKKDGQAFGRLHVSKGALVWKPQNRQYGYKLQWQRFSELAAEHGTDGHK